LVLVTLRVDALSGNANDTCGLRVHSLQTFLEALLSLDVAEE
jgi:hypothetical protein